MSEPYELVIKAQARRALAEVLAPSVAFAVWEFISRPLRENPAAFGEASGRSVSRRLVGQARALPGLVPD